MRWFYPKHVPEFAKYKDEDRVHFKWLQYDVDLNLLVSNMDNVQERDAVREYFTHNRYSMKVITGEDHLPPHVGAAFPRFFPWKDPFREMYLHYGHASKAPERPSAQTPAPLGETSSRKRRRVPSPCLLANRSPTAPGERRRRGAPFCFAGRRRSRACRRPIAEAIDRGRPLFARRH